MRTTTSAPTARIVSSCAMRAVRDLPPRSRFQVAILMQCLEGVPRSARASPEDRLAPGTSVRHVGFVDAAMSLCVMIDASPRSSVRTNGERRLWRELLVRAAMRSGSSARGTGVLIGDDRRRCSRTREQRSRSHPSHDPRGASGSGADQSTESRACPVAVFIGPARAARALHRSTTRSQAGVRRSASVPRASRGPSARAGRGPSIAAA